MRIFILVTIALILTASWQQTQAETVCVEGDTAIGIKDLVMVTDQYGTINVDVDFNYTTGYTMYGSGLNQFPFTDQNAEEDVAAAVITINHALTENSPVPVSAGQPGQDAYYIGATEELGQLGAFGGESVQDRFWELCSEGNDCILGAAVLEPDQRYTYADLRKAEGGNCGGAPPPPGSYDIIPCITGSWFLLARDGEGYNIEIIGSSLAPEMLAFHYTYDDAGNQVYLIGQGLVDGDTAVLPTQITSGPVYGNNYDPADLLREDWGTLTFTFTSKTTGTVKRESTMAGFGGTTNVDIERLSYITGLTCP